MDLTEKNRDHNKAASSYLKAPIGMGIAFTRVILENNILRPLSPSVYQPDNSSGSMVLCYCDGLFLISRHKDRQQLSYMLWNPSRGTHTKLQYPYPSPALDHNNFDNRGIELGICYDPLVKDYKVVVGDKMHYAVYYCKTNSWSKELSASYRAQSFLPKGVPFNGSIYWLTLEFEFGGKCRFNVARFDGRDEKFKKTQQICGGSTEAFLISSGDGLYVFFPNYACVDGCNTIDHVVIMKKDGDDDAWIEFDQLKLPCSCDVLKPLCRLGQQSNVIILEAYPGEKYLLFDESERCFREIQDTADLNRSYVFPYQENMH